MISLTKVVESVLALSKNEDGAVVVDKKLLKKLTIALSAEKRKVVYVATYTEVDCWKHLSGAVGSFDNLKEAQDACEDEARANLADDLAENETLDFAWTAYDGGWVMRPNEYWEYTIETR